MNTLRFSLAKLLGAVVLVALGLAALVNATDFWVRVSVTLAVLVLLSAIARALYSSDNRRAFWSGFAIFGWGYFVLGFVVPDSVPLVTQSLLDHLYPNVRRIEPPTANGSVVVWFKSDGTVLVDGEPVKLEGIEAALLKRVPPQFRSSRRANPFKSDVEAVVYHDPDVDRSVARYVTDVTNTYRSIGFGGAHRSTASPSSRNFDQLGHALFVLLFAVAGGVITRIFYAARERRT